MSARRVAESSLALLSTVMLAVLASCAQSPRRGGLLQRLSANSDVSEAELEALVRDAAVSETEQINSLAYEVYLASQDGATRRRALMWMIRTSFETSRALSYVDPVAQLVELWVMSKQLIDYLEQMTADGEPVAFHARALELVRKQEERYRRLAIERAGLSNVSETIEQYAADNPTGDMLLGRPSAAPLLATMQLPRQSGSLLSSTETFEEGMADIAQRIETLQYVLPDALAVHLRLLANEMLGDADLAALRDQLDRAIVVAETLPGSIDAQRIDTLEALRREREIVLADFDAQRIDTLDRIETLRRETFDDVDAQRVALSSDIDALVAGAETSFDRQRTATITEIDEAMERSAELIGEQIEAAFARIDETISPRLEAMLGATIDRSSLEATDVIDHAFWRLLQLVGVIFAGGIVLVLLARLGRRG